MFDSLWRLSGFCGFCRGFYAVFDNFIGYGVKTALRGFCAVVLCSFSSSPELLPGVYALRGFIWLLQGFCSAGGILYQWGRVLCSVALVVAFTGLFMAF